MQGGTISSGVFSTSPVCGAYWINWISSFSKTTEPGVIARLRPTSKAELVDAGDPPLLEVIDQVLHPVRQAHGTGFDRFSDHLGIGRWESSTDSSHR